MTLNPQQFGDEDILDALAGGTKPVHRMSDHDLVAHMHTHGIYEHVDSIEHMDQIRTQARNGLPLKQRGPKDFLKKSPSRHVLIQAHEQDHGRDGLSMMRRFGQEHRHFR